MTPLERAPDALETYVGRTDVWLKREDAHELGAFKWRSTLPVVSRTKSGECAWEDSNLRPTA